MSVTQLFPTEGSRSIDGLLSDVARPQGAGHLHVGDPRIVAFFAEVGRRLLDPEIARRQPELGSLGFFLRRAELTRTVERITAGPPGTVVVPRGLVVHFAPANVDTIFVYSWALSALAGNRNIVRLSSRSGPAADAALRVLRASVSSADPAVGATQRIVTYDRDETATAALSQACDVRVVWGGDVSVQSLRQVPIPPLARDMAFPDRSSFAVIDVTGWETASAALRQGAVDGFVDDLFWFDQAACASPRDLVWIGDEDAAASARRSFTAMVVEAASRRGWSVDPSMAIEKRVSTYALAASGDATRIEFRGNAIAEVELAGLHAFQRSWLGAGVICHVTAASLDDLLPWIVRRDQTMSQFGVPAAVLQAFATELAGRGVDRIVPFGHALRFAPIWDGMDLAREFTRLVTVQP